MKRKVMGYFLSTASVYLTMSYLTKIFLELIGNFSFNVM
jgi:hypothetical protein